MHSRSRFRPDLLGIASGIIYLLLMAWFTLSGAPEPPLSGSIIITPAREQAAATRRASEPPLARASGWGADLADDTRLTEKERTEVLHAVKCVAASGIRHTPERLILLAFTVAPALVSRLHEDALIFAEAEQRMARLHAERLERLPPDRREAALRAFRELPVLAANPSNGPRPIEAAATAYDVDPGETERLCFVIGMRNKKVAELVNALVSLGYRSTNEEFRSLVRVLAFTADGPRAVELLLKPSGGNVLNASERAVLTDAGLEPVVEHVETRIRDIRYRNSADEAQKFFDEIFNFNGKRGAKQPEKE